MKWPEELSAGGHLSVISANMHNKSMNMVRVRVKIQIMVWVRIGTYG